jgi:hypothetical protein
MNKKHEAAKLEAELDFTIKAMIPLLRTASNTAHKIEAAQDAPEDSDFDRLMDLGYLTDCAGHLCAPNLNILVRVMFELAEHGSPHDEKEPQQLHQH